MSSNFAIRMTEVIKDLGLSQADAARLAGIHRALISRYCSGKDHPRPETLSRITEALHVPVFVFFMDRQQAEPSVKDARQKINQKIVA